MEGRPLPTAIFLSHISLSFHLLSAFEEKFRKLQGTYPVIFLSFAGIKETNYPMTIPRKRYRKRKQEKKSKRKQPGRWMHHRKQNPKHRKRKTNLYRGSRI